MGVAGRPGNRCKIRRPIQAARTAQPDDSCGCLPTTWRRGSGIGGVVTPRFQAYFKLDACEEGSMNTNTFTRPSALAPIVMSLAALLVVLGRIALVGTIRSPDEGAAAHLFQLFIVGQLPIVAFFAIRWLQRTPKRALIVLASQGLAVLAALAPAFYFHL